MAEWVKRLAAKFEDLSSVPGTNMVEGGELAPGIHSLTSSELLSQTRVLFYHIETNKAKGTK